MFLNTDYLEPAELTGYVRAALADLDENRFALARWLPAQPIDDLEFRFNRGQAEGLLEAATFRAFDTEARLARRPGVARVSGELPPISRKIRLGEYDRLRQRKLDEKIGDQIYSDAERVVRAIGARFELARAEALRTGEVNINEDGVFASVDFGRNAAHDTAPTTLWDDPAATPIEDLLGWVEVYKANNDGQAPEVILTSSAVVSQLIRNAEVRMYITNGVAGPAIVTRDAMQSVLTAHGLPQVLTYDAQVRPDNAAAVRLLPANELLLLPSGGEAGSTLHGTPAESFEPDFGLAGDEAGVVAGVYKSVDPVALWTLASAIGLPIVGAPDLTFRSTVLP